MLLKEVNDIYIKLIKENIDISDELFMRCILKAYKQNKLALKYLE